jgi:hypothetical protein
MGKVTRGIEKMHAMHGVHESDQETSLHDVRFFILSMEVFTIQVFTDSNLWWGRVSVVNPHRASTVKIVLCGKLIKGLPA